MNVLQPPGRAWLALCALLAAGSGLAWGLPTAALDWQPARAFSEPWRLLTAACVHFSALHLVANMAGTALVAALGWVARAPAALAAAWALSWPLTHAALALQPTLQPALLHYGGASGVLHGGVAAVAVWLLASAGPGRGRMLAGAIAAGLVVKLVLEQPWGPPLRQVPGWDIAIAPLAHAAGAVSAAVLAAAMVAVRAAVRARRQRA